MRIAVRMAIMIICPFVPAFLNTWFIFRCAAAILRVGPVDILLQVLRSSPAGAPLRGQTRLSDPLDGNADVLQVHVLRSQHSLLLLLLVIQVLVVPALVLARHLLLDFPLHSRRAHASRASSARFPASPPPRPW